MPSSHLIFCHFLLLLPSGFPSIRVFSNESVLHIRWPKYWSFSFSISPSNEYSGLISFRVDWLDLLADQETPKSLLQHHSSKASILQCSAFFIIQPSHPYMNTGKTIALTRRTVEGKEFCSERGSWTWIYIIYISGNILFFTISFTSLKDIPSWPFQSEVHINSPLGYRKIFKSPISPILRAKRNKNRKLDCYFPFKSELTF